MSCLNRSRACILNQLLRKFPHWNYKETWALIIKRWEQSITGVRQWNDAHFPQRFRDVIATRGQLSSW